LLSSCINRIVHGNWHEKYGIENSEQLSDIKILPKLIKALNDNDEYVQLSAIQEIKKFESQKTILRLL